MDGTDDTPPGPPPSAPPTRSLRRGLRASAQWLRQTIVVLVVLWPPTHFLVVNHFQMNPWRFAGFAMYATIPPQARAQIEMSRGPRLRRPRTRELTGQPRQAWERYVNSLQALGSLRRPDEVAKALHQQEDPDSVNIIVETMYLPLGQSRFACQRTTYHYPRQGPARLQTSPHCVSFSAGPP